MSSIFTRYSIAVVVENKQPNTRRVNCTPLETTALDGEVYYNPEETTYQFKDISGNQKQVKVTAESSFEAEWLPGDTNRVTPPDVRRGELVELYRLGDTDQYYWRSLGLRQELRCLETVIIAINASPEPASKNGVNFDNCYFLEISAHNRLVTFQTSKANGEPFRYTAQFNTGEGEFTITDDISNYFHINSAQRLLKLQNADNTSIELSRKTLNLKADESVSITVGGTSQVFTKENIVTRTNNFIAYVKGFFDIL